MTMPLPVPGLALANLSAIREWEVLMRHIGALAESAIDSTARPDRIWRENGLEQLITNTAPGDVVGDSGYTREGALAARRFVEEFMAWAATEITVTTLPDGTEVRMSPLQILSARSSVTTP
jgi:hypothetical protein